jgi:hypothetical protein
MRDALRDEEGRPVLAYFNERVVNGHRVQLRFALVEGRLVCVGLEIGPSLIPKDNGGSVLNVVDDYELDALRSTDIRLPLRDLVDEALEGAVTAAQGLRPETAARFGRHRAAAKEGLKKPGRPPVYGDDHYQQVAKIYEDTLRSGRRDPLRAIMRELKVEKTAAASKVREARRRGFLTMNYFKEERQ